MKKTGKDNDPDLHVRSLQSRSQAKIQEDIEQHSMYQRKALEDRIRKRKEARKMQLRNATEEQIAEAMQALELEAER